MAKKTKTTKKESNAAAPSLPPVPNTPKSEIQFDQARAEIKKIIASEEIDQPEENPVAVKKITVEADDAEDSAEPAVVDLDSTAPIKAFSALYQSNDEDKVDMTTIVRKDPHRKKKIISLAIGILVVLLAAALTGFYFFVHRGDKFNEDDVIINPQVPMTVASGGEFSMTLEIQNRGTLSINDVEVVLQPPAEFMFASSNPEATGETYDAWQLGTIKAQSDKQVVITGALTGDTGSLENFEVVVSYKPSNFNSTFTKNKSFGTTINESILALDLSVPAKAVSGRPAEYKIKYTNNAKDTLRHLRLAVAIIPDGMVASDLNPAASRDNLVWDIDKLEADGSGTVTFKGVITGDEGSARELKIELGYVDDQGTYHKQTESSAIIFIVNPQLVVTLSINDASTDGMADFGGKLNYVLKYRNDSQSDIKDMSIAMTITGEAADWQTLTMPVVGTVTDSVIRWTAQQIPALKTITPGSSGEIQFSIATKETIQAQKITDKNYSLVSKATVSSQDVTDLEGTSLEVASNTITTKLTSRLDLRAEGRYYDDQFVPVGQGPLPPQVGVATTYELYWYIQNNANEVRDVVVKAVVPANAVWVNDATVSAGAITYDAATRIVSWSINKIPPQVGQTIPELSAHFSITVTPQATDVGSAVNLLGASELTAFDTFTEVQIVKSREAITTDLKEDAQAAGKGTVVSQPTNANTNTE